jgi:lipoate-protein ligase A
MAGRHCGLRREESEWVSAPTAENPSRRSIRPLNHQLNFRLNPMLSPARRWKTLVTAPMTGAANMALDEALMDRAASSDEWICRIYGWIEPTVSFGRNQAAARHYDRSRIDAAGLSVVRRPTGGRAILHHREITYAVAAPVSDAGGLHESYLLINQLLVAGLSRLGVAVAMADSRPQPMQPGPIPCFDHPSAGELTADGRKLVGSAQWRSERALLQHGSILLDDDQAALAGLLQDGSPVPETPPAATLRALLGDAPSLDEVADAIFSAIRAADGSVSSLVMDRSLTEAAARLSDRYADPTWTWRR